LAADGPNFSATIPDEGLLAKPIVWRHPFIFTSVIFRRFPGIRSVVHCFSGNP
jgi:hypothetical protein